MIADTFWQRWIWPAGGSGGIPGDVVGSVAWALIAALVAMIFWPPLRHAIERLFHRVFSSHPIHDEIADIRRAIDHVIEHHPTIPPLADRTTAPMSDDQEGST